MGPPAGLWLSDARSDQLGTPQKLVVHDGEGDALPPFDFILEAVREIRL